MKQKTINTIKEIINDDDNADSMTDSDKGQKDEDKKEDKESNQSDNEDEGTLRRGSVATPLEEFDFGEAREGRKRSNSFDLKAKRQSHTLLIGSILENIQENINFEVDEATAMIQEESQEQDPA